MRVAAIPRQLLYCSEFLRNSAYDCGLSTPFTFCVGQYDHDFLESRSEFLQLVVFLYFSQINFPHGEAEDKQAFLTFPTKDETLACGFPLHISLESNSGPGTAYGTLVEDHGRITIQLQHTVIPESYIANFSPWARERLSDLIQLHTPNLEIEILARAYSFSWGAHLVATKNIYVSRSLAGAYTRFRSLQQFLELKKENDIHLEFARSWWREILASNLVKPVFGDKV